MPIKFQLYTTNIADTFKMTCCEKTARSITGPSRVQHTAMQWNTKALTQE
jgi:hypothetical protein